MRGVKAFKNFIFFWPAFCHSQWGKALAHTRGNAFPENAFAFQLWTEEGIKFMGNPWQPNGPTHKAFCKPKASHIFNSGTNSKAFQPAAQSAEWSPYGAVKSLCVLSSASTWLCVAGSQKQYCSLCPKPKFGACDQ